MSDRIETGSCSACGGAAERGSSGAWWHVGEPCTGIPGRSATGFRPARQQQTPRDRQIKHPGRDR